MPAERLVLFGVNHKTTPVHIREQMALQGGYEEPLRELKKLQGCKEVYLLSTCNRVEMLFVTEEVDALKEKVVEYLFASLAQKDRWQDYLYIYYDDEAARHLFMVSSSLDSMMVGEAQILGQIKEAYRYAARLEGTGALLNTLLHKSFSVAKRVRSETGIGSSAVSISYAAVQLAQKIFGDLGGKKVLLIGAGEMAELAAEHLVGNGVTGVVVANRTLSRAVDLAARFGGKAVSLDEIQGQLEEVDIVISSTGASGEVLMKEDVRPIMKMRRNRPLFFIDIAVPRDLDSQLIELENVFLYDIDDLNNVVELNKSERQKEAVKAKRIVDEETIKFSRWREGMAFSPTIRAMQQKVETICLDELERTLNKLPDLDSKEKEQLERMARAIAAKILYDPLQYLKKSDCEKSDNRKIYTLRNIFKLSENGDE